MANGPRGEVSAVQASERIPCDKKDINCVCCKNMALELSEVKLELSSCMEIIRILQEEIRLISSSYQPSENKTNEDSANKEPNNAAASGDWTYLPLI